MSFSKELLEYTVDADLHTKVKDIAYSTALREIVTVGHMIQHYQDLKEVK